MEKADKLSKFISLVLRHNPAAAHVTLDRSEEHTSELQSH